LTGLPISTGKICCSVVTDTIRIGVSAMPAAADQHTTPAMIHRRIDSPSDAVAPALEEFGMTLNMA
jgi:hypothetical protein